MIDEHTESPTGNEMRQAHKAWQEMNRPEILEAIETLRLLSRQVGTVILCLEAGLVTEDPKAFTPQPFDYKVGNFLIKDCRPKP